jgi:glycosyltransferase involved in cell wall biosynthesis
VAVPASTAPPALYAAFDRLPSTKGAGVHIGRAAPVLFSAAGGGLLHVLGGGDLPVFQHEDLGSSTPVEIVRFVEPIPNLLERAVAYGEHLTRVAGAVWADVGVVQARDPWSIAPLLDLADHRGHRPRFVYEVNGLPSVELPETHPTLPDRTRERVAALEQRCLEAADAIVVPSAVIAAHLVGRGVDEGRVHVVRNGADPVDPRPPRPPEAPDRYLAYVGALQPWQGLPTALAALSRLVDLDVELVVCASVRPNRARLLRRLARRLGIEDRVHWHHQLPHREIAAWLAHAQVSLAPLADCRRNVDQGCCPLKVLESMAAGTAVVASDLAAVRELVTDRVHGRLVAPDRPAELARAVRVLLEVPGEADRLGAAGRDHVAASLTWDHSRDAQLAVYRQLGLGEEPVTRVSETGAEPRG